MLFSKGMQIRARNDVESGLSTGSTHRCRMAGCTGLRVTVRWKNGKVTHPCSKGMELLSDGSARIL